MNQCWRTTCAACRFFCLALWQRPGLSSNRAPSATAIPSPPRSPACGRGGRSRAWAWLAALLVGAAAHAHDVTDDRGVTVHFDAPPQRVVSVLPSLTETVCAIGGCARLVGVDRYSNWPAAVKALPQVGGGLDPNIEAVVALKPDVVLMATSSRAAERLRALGVKVVALEPKTGADVKRVMGKLGQLLALPDAERVARETEAGVAAAAQALPPALRGQRVYFEASPGPHAAGPQSFIGELLTTLGLVNVIGPELGPFPKINPELVVRAEPDLIMAGERSGSEIARRPGWQRLRAVRGQHVCLFNAQEVDILVRPGPRMPEAAQLMVRCVIDHGIKERAR